MHVVAVSFDRDPALRSAEELLARYETLTGWADGVRGAGARVSVVQRFSMDIDCRRAGILYRFVGETPTRPGSPLDRPGRLCTAIRSLQPDILHCHGLRFARQAAALKCALPGVPVLVQDHAGGPPRRWWSRAGVRAALNAVDGVLFAAQEQAEAWQRAGVLRADLPVYELMEGSSRMRLGDRDAARRRTGLAGAPLCLWVGRLDANKDPLTVLQGFEIASRHLPGARMVMAYGTETLLPDVRAWLRARPGTACRVTLLGTLPPAALADLYNSADLFVLGSHHEGSGYAVLEALSCGVVPVVTDIPSFRVLTGHGAVGRCWPVGDPQALAGALRDAYRELLPETPRRVRAHFETRFSFEAIGARALSIYEAIVARSAQTTETGRKPRRPGANHGDRAQTTETGRKP